MLLHVHVFMIPYCAVVGVYVSSILHFHITLHYALVGVCRGVALVSFWCVGAPGGGAHPHVKRPHVGTTWELTATWGNLGVGEVSRFPTGL